jgi:hypothetical protein
MTLIAGIIPLFVNGLYLFIGPGFMREDWWEVFRVRECGPIACPGIQMPFRAGEYGYYDVLYSVFGTHIGLIVALLAVINACIGIALFRLLALWFSSRLAILAVVMWELSPTHMTVSIWPSLIQGEFALLFLLTGLYVFKRKQSFVLGCVLMFLSVFSYEATVVVVTAAIVIFGGRRRRTVIGLVCVLGPMVPDFFVSGVQSNTDFVPLTTVFGSVFVFCRSTPQYVIPGLLIALGSVLVLRKSITKQWIVTNENAVMIIAGIAVVIFGALPYMQRNSDAMFLSIGDRAAVVTAIGAGMIWAGVVNYFCKRNTLLLLACVAYVALCVPALWTQDQRWSQVTHRTTLTVARVNELASKGQTTFHLADDPRYFSMHTYRRFEVHDAVRTLHPELSVQFVEPGPGVVELDVER